MKARLYRLAVLIVALLTTYISPVAARPTVAIVLGGGAARGFSHIGIIKAMEESGIPVDILVGTSMGSIVAGLYASGYSTDNLGQIMSSMDSATLFDIPFPPRGGLLKTDKFEVFLRELLQGKTFADLPLPFYSVISELRTGEELALHDGSVSSGIQASMSIPGVFPPVRIDNKYYIDGGMKNAVPVDVARKLGADIVIGVDVKKDLKEINYNSIINNLQLTLWFMTDGYVQQRQGDADVIITPDVQYDSYMEYQRNDYFIQEGYEAGLAAIEKIKSVIRSKDPEFTFVPYRQQGVPHEEMAKRVQKAAQVAADTPSDLTIKPIFLLTYGTYYRPGIGALVGGGPLKYGQVGYILRYPLPGQNRIHEGLIAYDRPAFGRAEAFVRKPQNDDDLSWGLRYRRLLDRDTELSLSLMDGPTDKWEVNLDAANVWSEGQWRLATTANLQSERTDVEGKITARLSPELIWNFRANATPVLEVALAQPYLYGGVDYVVPVSIEQSPQHSYYVGTGVSFRLFGLYPSKARAGVTFQEDGNITWRATIGLR